MDRPANMTQSHMFNVGIATEYGVYEAILLNNLYFWITKNEANGKHYHDGHYWTYNSTKAFSHLFPYFSEKQVRTILGKLEKHGLIVTGNYNQSAYDRTKWYALTAKAYALFGEEKSILPNGQMENTGRENENAQKGEPIPDSKPDIKPSVKPDEEKREKKTAARKSEPKHRHGEFKHVLLTDRELEKLKADFPNDYQRMIRDLDEYLEMHPSKSYANHNLTMRRWERDDREKARKATPASKQAIVTRSSEEIEREVEGLVIYG